MADEGPVRAKEGYHHGDLRRALVAAAAAIIAEEGEDALTLRGVGQRLGVSRTALYRHFDGKVALLAAVALEGFRHLRRDLEAALGAAEAAGADPVVALLGAYVEFGAARPAHYRTMFGPALRDQGFGPDLAEAGRAAFGVLVGVIADGQAASRLAPGDPARLAQVAWATVHGVVMLGDAGRFGPGSPAPEAGPGVAPLAASVLLAGLLARPG